MALDSRIGRMSILLDEKDLMASIRKMEKFLVLVPNLERIQLPYPVYLARTSTPTLMLIVNAFHLNSGTSSGQSL